MLSSSLLGNFHIQFTIQLELVLLTYCNIEERSRERLREEREERTVGNVSGMYILTDLQGCV